MLHRRLCLLLCLTSAGFAQVARYELTDHLHQPGFAWPRTLLGYPLPAGVSGPLRVVDLAGGADVPCQVAGGKVWFCSDLPSGGQRRYELRSGASPTRPPGVKTSRDAQSLTLDTGLVAVRLPTTRTFAPGASVPGPLAGLRRDGAWVGGSTLLPGRRRVLDLTLETLEYGPLFVTCALRYRFDGGGGYRVVVRAIAGYDFVEWREEMVGLSPADGVAVDYAWTGFHPTHRWTNSTHGGVHRVDEPVIAAFRGEDPAFSGPSAVEDPAKEYLARLTPFDPNGWGGMREAAFWNATSGDALGLFIRDTSQWEDHQYALWTSADTLRVRYRYADGVLHWRWPLATGTRQTGLAAYRQPPVAPEDQAAARPLSYRPCYLRNRYGELHLDRVKDWQLTYPDDARRPDATVDFGPGRMKSADAYDAALDTCSVAAVAEGMYHPVSLRDMHYWVAPDFAHYRANMTPRQRERATAMLLLAGYLSAQEEFSPVRTMLGGHPNFMADYKYPLAAAACLFPDHPRAATWRAELGKFLELVGRFNVRPNVAAWQARGGRWTESIATYNWAFLEPLVQAQRVALATDGRNRFATPWFAQHAGYLAGIATAPITLLDKTGQSAGAPQRVHPPMGAHSGRRGIPVAAYELGTWLQRYDPLTAEALMWLGGGPNKGTNPHLASAKYTGFGCVLRAAVDTPREVAVFLQQLDKGPNYRWGFGNEGGCGDLYYYAAGQSYSGHLREDAGDRRAPDASATCNTGVYKDLTFRCIGMNELTRPLYDLGVAQFAELVPREGPDAYSWPEYRSRSVLLVGADYAVTYDATRGDTGTRASWFTGDGDLMPTLQTVKGGAGWPSEVVTHEGQATAKGVWFQAHPYGGDRMLVVSHRPEVKLAPRKRGDTAPYTQIDLPDGTDYLFEAPDGVRYHDRGLVCEASVALIRQWRDGRGELALVHGRRLGVPGVTVTVSDPDLGLSLRRARDGSLDGDASSPRGGEVTLELATAPPAGTKLYLDGYPWPEDFAGGRTLRFAVKRGGYHWQVTASVPLPGAPRVLGTLNGRGGASVRYTRPAGATSFRLELSRDNGATWQPAGESTTDRAELTGLTAGTKVHVRVTAVNESGASAPSAEYPVYVTDQPPLPPDGLRAEWVDGELELSWGQVLGVGEYRLYRRLRGTADWTEVDRGTSRALTDRPAGLVPPDPQPGGPPAADPLAGRVKVYEYAVSAVNGIGEGPRSLPIDTDPTGWGYWQPAVDRRFNRQTAWWLPPYVRAEAAPPRHYPD